MPEARREDGRWWWGATPVPATSMWTGELDAGWLAPCLYADRQLAVHAPQLQGVGKPMFKNPHPVRQRRAMAKMLCDICARPLAQRTKHLLAPGRWVRVGQDMLRGYLEPCVCRECLPLARRWCPHVQTFEPWPPPVVRRSRTMAQVIAPAGMVEVVGKGTFDRPAVGYLKLYMPEETMPFARWLLTHDPALEVA